MFDHVTIRVADRAASERFYDTVLTPLGLDATYRTELFFITIVLSLAAMVLAVGLARRLWNRLGAWNAVIVAGLAAWNSRVRGMVTVATVNVVGQVVRAVPTTTTAVRVVVTVTASTVQEPKYVRVEPLARK